MTKQELKKIANNWCIKNYKKFNITKKEAKIIFK